MAFQLLVELNITLKIEYISLVKLGGKMLPPNSKIYIVSLKQNWSSLERKSIMLKANSILL